MKPSTEPNSLPPLFSDVRDWRDTYSAYVEAFKASPKTYSDVVLLKIQLKRLGFVGLNLEREIEFVKENSINFAAYGGMLHSFSSRSVAWRHRSSA